MKKLYLVLLLIGIIGCAPKKMEKSNTMIESLKTFISKEKFVSGNSFPGLSHPELKSCLSDKINRAAEDFISVASANPTDELYQNKIRIGLNRFSPEYLNLDTEDRERICRYFEEMMDIIGLESSDGHLNDFMYSFNPE